MAHYHVIVIPPTDKPITWSTGRWLNPPLAAIERNDELIVTAAEESDFWRTTAYGFIHDDGHALLQSFDRESAVEVSFRLDYDGQFDQAGVLIRGDANHWIKAGVEFSDGLPQLGAVVTHELSDWSVGPVPAWAGSVVTVRVSRAGDAVTMRARSNDGEWQLVRVAPWAPELTAEAGPFCCAPMHAGLEVSFTSWRAGPADEQLHP